MPQRHPHVVNLDRHTATVPYSVKIHCKERIKCPLRRDNTKAPLTVWFWVAYLMTTDKRGASALLLQRQLGLRRYETA
jgi:hypothetical protein